MRRSWLFLCSSVYIPSEFHSCCVSLEWEIYRPAYPSIFACSSTEIGRQYGSTPVFLKIRIQSFQKVRKVNDASLLPGKPIVEGWWGVIVHWHSHISSHFWGWSIWPVLIGPKSLLNQWTSTLHQNFTEVSNLPIHVGFEFEAVGDKWLHEMDGEEEECTKPGKQTPTRQQLFKKGRVGISESSTHGALFLEKVFYGLQSRTTFADVNKIKSSECVVRLY